MKNREPYDPFLTYLAASVLQEADAAKNQMPIKKGIVMLILLAAGIGKLSAQAYYQGASGRVVMDVEFAEIGNRWSEQSSLPNFTGTSYYVATQDAFQNPGLGKILEYSFRVDRASNYQLQWRSAITNPTTGGFSSATREHNDNWARLVDASGNTVAPSNASNLDPRNDSNGKPWYKVYHNDAGRWTWQSSNVDFNPKPLYWNLQTGQTYTLLISARSNGHAIDRILLWDRDQGPTYGSRSTGNTNNTEDNRAEGLAVSQIQNGGGGVASYMVNATQITDMASGVAPFSVDSIRNALQIDAANEAFREVWARASVMPGVDSGLYDIRITAMQETDGESPYQLIVNDQVIGTKVNAKIFGTNRPDYTLQEHVFANVYIPAGATVSVESQAVTNGEIPEGDGTAYSRGRWTKLEIASAGTYSGPTNILGEQKQWHKVTLTVDGPSANESDNSPNPFFDYRMIVTFSKGNTSISVPGYFAADGWARETSASSGDKWRAHFVPTETGTWTYDVDFRQGSKVAINTTANAGNPMNPYDAYSGSFEVIASDKSGKDFRAPGKGKLVYTGKPYPEWMGGDGAFVKAAVNSPELFLEYVDFDNTNSTRSYATHSSDWQSGDPTWRNGRGSEIIGVVNYLSSVGINSHYFLTMNSEGDGGNAFPWNSSLDFDNYDTSKTDQWQVVFDHMMSQGVQVQFVLGEQENQTLFENPNNGGSGISTTAFEDTRKLYYREMIARFGYLNAVIWNLGEENGWLRSELNNENANANTYQQRIAYADYLESLLAYQDNITIHNGPSNNDDIFDELVTNGIGDYRGISYQGGYQLSGDGHGRVSNWRTSSAAAGTPWIVAYDEPFTSGALNTNSELNTWRKNSLWAALTAGAAGVGMYDGAGRDLTIEDYRENSNYWTTTARATQFFAASFPDITVTVPNDSLVTNGAWCLAHLGNVYVVYLPNGGTTSLDLTSITGTFDVRWFNPRSGGNLQNGSVATVSGGSTRALGNAPGSTSSDWAILVTRQGGIDLEPNITTLSLADAVLNQAYSQNVIVSGGDPPLTWSTSAGTLPVGLALNTATGEISGTPIALSASSFTILVTDTDGDIDSQALSINVVEQPSGGTANFFPVDDAYLEGTTLQNDSFLKVENGNRVGYLKFDVSGITTNVDSALLSLTVDGEGNETGGDGTFNFFQGDSNSWTEETLTNGNKPELSGLVGSTSGTLTKGQTRTIDVTSLLDGVGNGTYTIIVVQEPNGNDVWFSSKEGVSAPQLAVTYSNAPANLLPTVSFTAPSDPTIPEGYIGALRVSASASDSDGSVSNVKLLLDNNLVREDDASPFEWGLPTQGDTALEALSAGTYELKLVATDNDGATGEATLTLAVESSTPQEFFDLYVTDHPELNGVTVNFNTNSDSAALNDGLEYALGGRLTDGADDSSLLPTIELVDLNGARHIEFTFRKRKDATARGLTYIVEYSDTLEGPSWVTDATTELAPTAIDSYFDEVVVRIPAQVNARFVRLRVQFQ